MGPRFLAVAGTLCVILGGAVGLYTPDSAVIQLTSSNFKQVNSDEIWLVEFYAPW